MLCECIQRSNAIRTKRLHQRRLQLELPFPIEQPEASLTLVPHRVALERQPSNFPRGWYRMSLLNPFRWREMYYARWVEARKAKGLPHIILNPLPTSSGDKKITSRREGTSAGNAVPGQLCAPRQMTARAAGGTTYAAEVAHV